MIESYSFGSMKIGGVLYKKDLKILNGQVVPDWWRKEGHNLSIEDISDIIEARPKKLVIGTGYFGLMKVKGDVEERLSKVGIELIKARTGKAATIFNELLKEGEAVAGAFHLTC